MMFRLDKDTGKLVGVEWRRLDALHERSSTADRPEAMSNAATPLTNLPPGEENGGDVVALRGTDVLLHIVPTMKTSGGQILFKDGGAAPLSVQADGTLDGSFKLQDPGFYRIELVGPKGEKVEASPQYTIDVLDDLAPTVVFSKPGRDTGATAVEEVFTEVKADDDFGVRQVQMVYSVNGGPQKTIPLFGGAKPLTQVSAGHTIYLEEMGLQPGDFVSYFAKVTDNNQTASSDIYFRFGPSARITSRPTAGPGWRRGGGGDAASFRQQRDRGRRSNHSEGEEAEATLRTSSS